MLIANKDLRNTRTKLQELKGHIEGPQCAIVKEVLNNALRIEVYDFQLPSLKHLVKGTAISVGDPQSVSSQSPALHNTPYGISHTPPQSPDGAEGSEQSSKLKYTSDALADKKQKALYHMNEKSHHTEPKAGNPSKDKKSEPKPLSNDGKLQTSKKSELGPQGSVDDSMGKAKRSSDPSSMTDSSKEATRTTLSEASGNVKIPDPNITEEIEPDDDTEAKARSKRELVHTAIRKDGNTKDSEDENNSTVPPPHGVTYHISQSRPPREELDKWQDSDTATPDNPSHRLALLDKDEVPGATPQLVLMDESSFLPPVTTWDASDQRISPKIPTTSSDPKSHKPPGKQEMPSDASAQAAKPKRTRTLAVPDPMSFHSMNSSLTVHVLVYDITALNVEAIVNAVNIHLKHSGGVAKAISKAAGKSLEADCKKYIKTNGPLHVTSNMVSSARNLPCKSVIHAAGPAMNHYKKKEDCFRDVHETLANVISTATSNHFLSLGIPAISSGKLNILS